MCGIVGIVGKNITVAQSRFVQQALITDMLRGRHSTGLLTIKSDLSAEWYKDTVDGAMFTASKTVVDMLGDYSNTIGFVGHNRSATVGNITMKNAHPFRQGDIILVHNGTLASTWGLPGHGKFDVDSEAIAHSINEIGAEKTIKKLDGAFALVWYNLKDTTINFVRNDERPLWFGKVEGKNLLAQDRKTKWIYGSELLMLKWLAHRNDIEVSDWWQPSKGEHVKFDANGNFKKPHIKKLELCDNFTYGNVYYMNQKKLCPVKEVTDGEVSKGDVVEFWPVEFKYYSHNTNLGELWGCMTNDPYTDIIVHSIDPKQWGVYAVETKGNTKHVMPKELYSVKVTGVSNYKGVPQLRGLVHDLYEIVTMEEAGKGGAERWVPGPKKDLIPESEWNEATQYGCAWCQKDLDIDEAGVVYWMDTHTVLCEGCTNHLNQSTSGEAV